MHAMILINLVALLVVWGAVCGLSERSGGFAAASWLSVGIFVLNGLCLFSPVLFAQGIFLLIAGLACIVAKARPRTYMIAATLLSVAAFGVPFLVAQPLLRDFDALRAEYPPESLSRRLTYEGSPDQISSDDSPAPDLHEDVEMRLAMFESRGSRMGRDHHLARLHSASQRQFVASRGFGVVRMAGVSERALELPPEEPIKLPEAPPPSPPEYFRDEESSSESREREFIADASPTASSPAPELLWSTHSTSLEDFLDIDRMGYARDVDHVVGFNSHRFGHPVEAPLPETWQVTRLELVSLLKHETPLVYASDHLPAMDELDSAPTRPLDRFELGALPKLRHEQDLVTETGTNQIRMLGSLRAGADCLDCHQVRRGELLGAFTYVLDRLAPVSEPAGTDVDGADPI